MRSATIVDLSHIDIWSILHPYNNLCRKWFFPYRVRFFVWMQCNKEHCICDAGNRCCPNCIDSRRTSCWTVFYFSVWHIDHHYYYRLHHFAKREETSLWTTQDVVVLDPSNNLRCRNNRPILYEE